MKLSGQIFVLGVLCIGFVFTGPSDQLLYEDEQKLKGIIDGLINDTINNLIKNLSEPITIASLSFNFSNTLLSGQASISDFSLSGLKKLVATKIDVSILSMALNATILIPGLTINTKYFADIVAAELVPLYGSGRAGITLDDIEIDLGGKVSMANGLQIANVTVEIGLGAATFDLHGLLNNEDFSTLVNQVLTDNVASFINEYKEVIGNIISPIAQALINSILSPNKTTIDSEIINKIELYHLE